MTNDVECGKLYRRKDSDINKYAIVTEKRLGDGHNLKFYYINDPDMIMRTFLYNFLSSFELVEGYEE